MFTLNRTAFFSAKGDSHLSREAPGELFRVFRRNFRAPCAQL